MKVAVIGGGFSGLAVAWQLLHQNICQELTLFDAKGIGGGASGIAAGLLHPFAGAHAKFNIHGLEGMAATKKLIEAATQIVGSDIIISKGLLRLALSDDQKKHFFNASQKNLHLSTWDENQVQKIFPYAASATGIYIEEALTINSQLYLQGLWEGCRQKGAQFIQHTFSTLKELDASFDYIVVAIGAYTHSVSELTHLPLTKIKGQILELTWPKDIQPLSFAINSQGYVCMNPDRQSCIAGSTFERDFTSEEPDLESAKSLLLPKIYPLIPKLEKTEILSCKAALRASAPRHLPLLKQIDKKIWVLSGMGSKGLLWHALYAEMLVNQLT